jgi:hypothetical protein
MSNESKLSKIHVVPLTPALEARVLAVADGERFSTVVRHLVRLGLERAEADNKKVAGGES